MKILSFKYLNSSGQTLIELMIGIAVVAIGLTAIVSLTTRSIRTTDAAQYRKEAVKLSRSKAEEVKYDREITPNWNDFLVEYTGAGTGVKSETTTDGVYTWTITTVNCAVDTCETEYGTSGVVYVEVEVEWEDVVGRHYCEGGTPDACIKEEFLLTKWK